MVSVITETGPCGSRLERTCKIIAIYNLIVTALGAIIMPDEYFDHFETIISFIFVIIANIGLLIGSILRNPYLVGIWIVKAVFVLIAFPIVLYMLFYHGEQFEHMIYGDSMEITLFAHIFGFLIFLLLGRYVLSFHVKLRAEDALEVPKTAIV